MTAPAGITTPRLHGRDGEMAGRIRAFDWSATSLGPIAEWPQSLMTAVEMCLDSGFPTFVLWGPKYVQIYNDPGIAIQHSKHPAALGSPVAIGWPEAWDTIRPLIDQVVTSGQPVTAEDMPALLDRDGELEPAWFTFCYSALRDETGQIAGIQSVAIETTNNVKRDTALRGSEERQAFLLRLADDLSRLTSPDDIVASVSTHIGPRLGLSTCVFADVDEARQQVSVHQGWNRDDVPSLKQTFRMADYLTEEFQRVGRAGEVLVVSDTAHDSRTNAEAYAQLKVGAFVIVPFHRAGRWTHFFAASSSVARDWSAEEIELFQEITDRVFPRVERARAEEALAVSEEKYRTLFESIDEGVTTLEVLFDKDERAVDLTLLENNSAFGKMTGLPSDVIGKRVSEVIPNLESFWLDTYGRVAKTGNPERFEQGADELNKWFDVHASPTGDGQVVLVYRDITERKRREMDLTFLAEVSQDLAHLTDIDETMTLLCGKIASHLNLSHSVFAEVHEAADEAEIHYGWHREDLPGITGRYRFSDFVTDEFRQAGLAGEMIVVRDTVTDPVTNAESYSALGVGSFVVVPLIRDRQWKFALAVYHSTPYDWREDEIALVRELTERVWFRLDRARVELTLREREVEYQTLFASIDQGFCTIEVLFDEQNQPVDYVFLEINPAFDRSTGIGNAAGQRMREMYPGHEQYWFETYGRIALSGEPERFEHEAVALGRWYDVFAYRIGEPEMRRVAILFEDITERHRLDDALRESEERFRAVGNLVPDLVWANDPEGHFTWVNQRWTNYTGQAPEEAAGHGWYEAVHPDERDQTYAAYQHAVDSEEPFEQEVRILDGGGADRWFLVRSVPTWDGSGAVSQRYGTATDIHAERGTRDELTARVAIATSELRLLSRRLLEVQEDERRYLASELHDEIGQALTGLQLQLASARRLHGKGSLAALEEAEHLVRELTRRVSELSIDLRPAALDTLGLLPAIVLLVGRVQERFGLTIDLRHQGLNDRFTPAVEIAAYRIVQESLTNVARHASTDAALVQILVDDKTMTVFIQDQGGGFDFEALTRSGGLSGMRERVELLNGVFAVESAPGSGTTITAEFPLPGPGKARRRS